MSAAPAADLTPDLLTADTVLAVLRTLRIANVREEWLLQCTIAAALDAAHIPYCREVILGSRARIDFVVADRIGIEVKKGKPNGPAVQRQLARYAAFGSLDAIILVVERSVFGIASEHALVSVDGRAVRGSYLGLSKLWGLAT